MDNPKLRAVLIIATIIFSAGWFSCGENAGTIGVAADDEIKCQAGGDCNDASLSNLTTIYPKFPFTSNVPRDDRYYDMTAVKAGNKVYFIGGKGTQKFNPKKQLLAYNLTKGAWTKLAPMNNARHDVGAIVMGNLIYALGGRDDVDDNKAEVYDRTTKKWTAKPDLSVDAGLDGAESRFFVGCNGNLYAVSTGRVASNLIIFESSDANTWTPYDSGVGNSQEPVLVASPDKVYIIGGNYGHNPNTFYEFNTSNHIFTLKAPHSITCRASSATAFYFNGKIYNLYVENSNPHSLDVYDIAGNSWSQLAIPFNIGGNRYEYIFTDETAGRVYFFNPYNVTKGFSFNATTGQFSKPK